MTKNYIRPTRGFNPDVITDLAKKKPKNFMPHQRFVTILVTDLIWDKYSGELIGFVDLGDCDINAATLVKPTELATHVLVFMVKSIVNPLSISLATFATTGVFSFQLMPIFWTAVSYLEKIYLKVISATVDGASPNRKLFRIHKFMDGDAGKNVVYREQNIYANDKRFIYFFSDVPHLIKTSCNCLANSGAGRATRFMWNNGLHILWSHISQLYYDDLDCGLKLVNKLTSDHINLYSYHTIFCHASSFSCTSFK